VLTIYYSTAHDHAYRQLTKRCRLIAQALTGATKSNRILNAKCQYLEEQFLKARHQQFGSSSEAHPAQGDLFDELETLIESAEPESTET
jgi:hypothetical protein